jgi:hypothetical protein
MSPSPGRTGAAIGLSVSKEVAVGREKRARNTFVICTDPHDVTTDVIQLTAAVIDRVETWLPRKEEVFRN